MRWTLIENENDVAIVDLVKNETSFTSIIILIALLDVLLSFLGGWKWLWGVPGLI